MKLMFEGRLLGSGDMAAVARAAWKSYRYAAKAIDALESVGLDIDGADPGKNGMAGLFGIESEAADILLALYGIPRASHWAEELDAALARAARQAGGDPFPEDLECRFKAAARAAIASGQVRNGRTLSRFDVTVAICGGMDVYATDIESAGKAARSMPSDAVISRAWWTPPEATAIAEGGA